MGYELLYDLQTIKRKKINRRLDWMKTMISIFAMAFVFIIIYCFASYLQMHLLGQAEVARVAAEQMVENLKTGSDLKDAVNAFCAEILK